MKNSGWHNLKSLMSKKSFKILVIYLLLTLFIPVKIFCSTDQKKPIAKNDRNQHEIRMVDSLNTLAAKVADSSLKLSQEYAKKALNLAKSIHYLKGEGEASILNSHYYLYYLQFSKSLEFCFSALQIANQSNDITLKTTALKKICLNFVKLKRADKAKSYFQKSFNLAINNKDTNGIIDLLVYLGQIYELEGNSKKSTLALYHALWYSNLKKNPRTIASVYKHIGNNFLSQMDLDNAEYYYRKSIDLNHKIKIPYDIGTLYSLIAHIYFLEKKLTESLRYNKIALDIRQRIHQEDLVASSFLNIGYSYMLMNKSDSSMIYFREGLDLANKLNIDVLQVQGNKYFYDWYLQRRDWKNALDYYRSYSDAKDSLNFAQKREETAIFEANQFISENEKKSALLEAENKVQKTSIRYNRIQIFFLGSLLLIILGVLYYTYRQFMRNKKSKIALQQLNDKLDIEIEERKQIEVQLRKSETLHHFLTDNSLDVIARIDDHYKYVYISPSCTNIYGYNQQEMIEMENIYSLIDPGLLKTMNISFKEMLKSKEPLKFTYRSGKKDGSSFWAESHINPIFDEESGELKEMITVIRDISERIAHEEALLESSRQKDLLMREIHHRAKNNFAILISLLSIQKFQVQNRELFDILTDLQTRIRTMVLIHEQLYRNNSVDMVSFGPYIMNLSKIIASAFKKEGIILHSEIAECSLNIETALPLGLIVNELLTNSFKYAFNGKDKGNIHIKLTPFLNAAEDETQKWELIIEDDGVGLPESFNIKKASSMGSQIIQTLVDQIHARIHVSGNEGASFRIIFPGAESN
jgi:PAS domain S-box-containing protein